MAPLQSWPASSPDPGRRFTPDLLAGLDEPVRRYFSHAVRDGAALPNGVRMAMSGRIKVGLWLPFTAEQTVDGRSFTWQARVGRTLFHAQDGNTARSAATRAAIESVVFAPPSVLPDRGVTWRSETGNLILARFDLPPERPEVRARIDQHGAIRAVSALRWGNAGAQTFQYIPFGGEIDAERRFGDFGFPAAGASAGGSTPRATRRSSGPRSARSRQRSDPSQARARPGRAARARPRRRHAVTPGLSRLALDEVVARRVGGEPPVRRGRPEVELGAIAVQRLAQARDPLGVRMAGEQHGLLGVRPKAARDQ